ncbi:MAG: ChbG/HpnK family deacetylase [Candidatus Omnitrophica bacterium]|nr:ChbG/HpnK family deacetylase [Candidatus Omnitrophota bacterium]
MKKVIINADDFGLTEGINKGIIEAHKKGAVTSASLMTNMPSFYDAIRLAKDNPGLGVGVHLNIVRGEPVLPLGNVRTLVDKEGFFLRNIFKIIAGIYQNKIDLIELESEWVAQIERALENGMSVTHLDSEKHLHLIGPALKILKVLAKRYKISKIRAINEPMYFNKIFSNPFCIFRKCFYKTLVVNLLSNQMQGLRSTDYFYGSYEAGNMILEKYQNLFSCLEDGLTEIMCHPGYIIGEQERTLLNYNRYSLIGKRERELQALINPKFSELVKQFNISLVSYKDV